MSKAKSMYPLRAIATVFRVVVTAHSEDPEAFLVAMSVNPDSAPVVDRLQTFVLTFPVITLFIITLFLANGLAHSL